MTDLLDLPQRSGKPRQQGITHVLDRGLSLAEVDGLIEVAGEFVDLVKLGWGTALATGNLEAKLERYRSYEIPAMLGGTLTELAISQDRLDRFVQWLHELKLEHIEISDGTITIAHEHKLELIERLSKEFVVLSEVGSKDDTRIMAPYRWVELIQKELEAGAWKVIAEARESGNVGIFRHDGPRKDQQVWFVRRFGPDVNLGNIPPEDVLSLETIRLGLRSDTAGAGAVVAPNE